MPKVTYLEFRPGRWVKLVDGKAVGPATAEEVAKWRREKTEPDRIWQDVVEEAAPSKAEPAQPPAEALAPEAKTAQAEQAGIWQDVLRQTTPSEAQPVHPPQVPIHAEELAEAEKPVPVPTAEAAPAKEAAKPKPRRATKAAPVTKPAEAVPTAKVVPAKEAAKPKPRRTAKAPKKEAAKPEPVPAAQATTVMEVAKPKPRRVRKAAPPKKVAKPKPLPTAEAAPVEDVVKPKRAPRAAPPEKEAEAKPTRRPRKPTARRRAKKPAPPASIERTGQLYLWMMAGPADDLLTTVRSGLARYEERFSEPAGAVLCHSDDLPTLELAGLSVDVRQGKGVPPRNFWIGPK